MEEKSSQKDLIFTIAARSIEEDRRRLDAEMEAYYQEIDTAEEVKVK